MLRLTIVGMAREWKGMAENVRPPAKCGRCISPSGIRKMLIIGIYAEWCLTVPLLPITVTIQFGFDHSAGVLPCSNDSSTRRSRSIAPALPPSQLAKLRLEQLEARDVPALWAVQLMGSTAGDTAATISDSLTANTSLPTDASGATLVEANSAQEAVGLAITGNITVQHAGETLTYSMDPANIGTTAAEHQTLLFDNGVIRLEDMARSSKGSDWDYNDRSWTTSVQEVPAGSSSSSSNPTFVWITYGTGTAENSSTDGWFTVHRNITAGALTVNYGVPSGSATLNVDYTLVGNGTSVTFAPGASTVSIFIRPIEDAITDPIEPTETVIMTLAGGNGYTVYTPNQATIPIYSTVAQIDLDVTNNGVLGDPGDGNASFLPGYQAGFVILTPTVVQQLQVIVTNLKANTKYNLRLAGTTRLQGIASNANSDPTKYGSSTTDDDYVLDAIDATTDGNGKLKFGLKCLDFGGRTTIIVSTLAGADVAKLRIPLDEDEANKSGDTLADIWEDAYRNVPAGIIGFDKTKKQSIAGINDSDRDDDLNQGGMTPAKGKNVGDRLPAFDEYRGFYIGGVHRRTSPVVKQIFVDSQDADPFAAGADTNNTDGLNRNYDFSLEIKVGGYADDLDAEILLILDGESDVRNATLGDVNYNSPNPYGGIKQKYVLLYATSGVATTIYGGWPGIDDTATRGPNQVIGWPANLLPPNSPLVGKKCALIHLGKLRTDIAFIDGDGSSTLHGDAPLDSFMMYRGRGGLPLDPLRDPNRGILNVVNSISMYYFAAADKVCWNDRNGDGHWDRGDELWIDTRENGKYDPITPWAPDGDKLIFDYDNNLQAGTAGVLLNSGTEFRYVRKIDPNVVGAYTDGDFIYTTNFNRPLYFAMRDQIIAHEVLGHPSELPHTDIEDGLSIMHGPNAGVAYTANGILTHATYTPSILTYIDPPTIFKDVDQDTKLQLRE